MDLKEQQTLGTTIDQHWYYRAKSAAILRLLGKVSSPSVVDVGAGSGYFSKRLLQTGRVEEAWCIDPNYEREFDECEGGGVIHYRHNLRGQQAALVLMIDVLEHVEDDRGLLAEYVGAVKAGSYFLITVPAFQWLWSDHDLFLEHYRRYTLKEVRELLQQAGVDVLSGSYFFGLLFPLAAAIRLSRKLKPTREEQSHSHLKHHSPLVNSILLLICRLELPLFRWNRLYGLSVICLGRKA